MPPRTTRSSSGIPSPSPTSSRSGTTRPTTVIGGMKTTTVGITTTRSPLSTLTTTRKMSGFPCATTVTTAKVIKNQLSVDVISDYDDDSGSDEDSRVSSDGLVKPFQHLKDQADSLRNTLRYAFPIQLRERLTSFSMKTGLNPSVFWNGLVVVLSFCENMQELSLSLPGWEDQDDEDEDEHQEAFVAPPHAVLRRLVVLQINIVDELDTEEEHTTTYIDPIFRSLTLPSIASVTITNDMEGELIECPAYTFMECQERSGSGFSLKYLSVDGIEWNTNHLIELLHRSPTLVDLSITGCPFDFGKLLRKLEVRPGEEYEEDEEEEEEEGITYAVEVHRHQPLFNFLPNLKIFELVVPPMERAYHPLSITSREVVHVLESRWDSDYGDDDYNDDDDEEYESENEDERVYCRLEEVYLCLPRPIMYGPDSMETIRRLESEGMKLKLKSS